MEIIEKDMYIGGREENAGELFSETNSERVGVPEG